MAVERRKYDVRGIVQGVGFRPFVFNLANSLGLSGWICNTDEGVSIEVQGLSERLDDFHTCIQTKKPAIAVILDIHAKDIPIRDEISFEIRQSHTLNQPNTIILPDLATCQDCLNEIGNPDNRRYRYPFTNCTNCGPRFSIIEKAPYDRKHTSMKHFKMCLECQREYEDPENRRFHAQPNACPACGPQLALWDADGKVIAKRERGLTLACELIQEGAIIALKGLGGFQLLCNATNEDCIQTLRRRKKRKEKPFALMYPSLELVRQHCRVSETEETLLTSQQAPIVLLKTIAPPAPNISPENPFLGVMLPYTPLHFLILNEIRIPVIATSGNRAEEPICIDEYEALKDLKGIADYFLVHNRPIAQYVDDSIVRVVSGKKLPLRRARGYASLPIITHQPLPSALAVGGHLKNTVAASRGDRIYLSQHLGDLENQKACESFSKEIHRLLSFYQIDPQVVVSDYHPDYFSTKFAQKTHKPLRECQHHAAHVYSCMAENKATPPLLGVSWDGTGYGLDQTVWGGEFFLINEDYSSKRIATFRPFRLPGSQKAVQEPRLSAVGMLYEILGKEFYDRKDLIPVQTFTEGEAKNLGILLSRGFQAPKCTSMGRIFDAVSSLIGQRHFMSFEGQAAMDLEFLCEGVNTSDAYPFQMDSSGSLLCVIDWEPMIHGILSDLHSEMTKQEIAAKFHNTLAAIILTIAEKEAQKKVVLSGGVFQNKVLTEKSVSMLKENGYIPYWHQEVPPNDGGIALGQLFSLLERSHVSGNSRESRIN